jgi:hypothetical protein
LALNTKFEHRSLVGLDCTEGKILKMKLQNFIRPIMSFFFTFFIVRNLLKWYGSQKNDNKYGAAISTEFVLNYPVGIKKKEEEKNGR